MICIELYFLWLAFGIITTLCGKPPDAGFWDIFTVTNLLIAFGFAGVCYRLDKLIKDKGGC